MGFMVIKYEISNAVDKRGHNYVIYRFCCECPVNIV
jgi:hypothetical protein